MKLLVLADLHISNTQTNFEKAKLKHLIKVINSLSYDRLVLAGDVFDNNKPTLPTIRAFYDFILALTVADRVVIEGNHDYSAFDYLPQLGFKYLHNQEYDGVHYLGWNHIHEPVKPLAPILISHARCSVPPHIKQEVDIKQWSEAYDLVILGDIHAPIAPFYNVFYPSSPFPTKHKVYKENAHGLLLIDTETKTTERVYINGGPWKHKVETNYEGLVNHWPSRRPDNSYRYIVEDTPENVFKLKDFSDVNVKIEAKPIIDKMGTESITNMQTTNILDLLLSYTSSKAKRFREGGCAHKLRGLLDG